MFLVNMLKYYVGFVDKVGGKIIFVGKWRCLQYILQRLRILMIFFLMVILYYCLIDGDYMCYIWYEFVGICGVVILVRIKYF